MKKTTKVLLTAMAMSAIMSAQAFAAEWLVDPAGYTGGVNSAEWTMAENTAQFEKFADDNVALVNAAGSDTEKVKVAATLISDYLSHDDRYTRLSWYYVMRDHKGVCDHYSYLMQALLGKAGMTCYFVAGSAGQNGNYGPHGWNIVYVDGIPRWVDVTWYDTSERMETYLMSDVLWSDHILNMETGMSAADYVAAHSDSVYTDNYKKFSLGDVFTEDGGNLLNWIDVPEGTVPMEGINGNIVYISQEDYEGYFNGTISIYELIAKYPGL